MPHGRRELAERVSAEIAELHEFFVAWLSGALPPDEALFAERFLVRLSPGLLVIQPGGVALDFETLRAAIFAGHGANPDFRIAIRKVALRPTGSNDLVLATYEEWQRNARNSKPPDNGRLTSVVFEADQGAPFGLRWLHVHETWLPAEVMAAGPYDF